MYGLSKRLLAFAFLLGLVSTLYSCQNTVNAPPQEKESKPIVYKSPIQIPYLVVNPLEIIETHVEETANHETTILISGLKDKTVETKINDRLRKLYHEIKTRDLPPYRGIRVRIPKGSEIDRSHLRANVTFNYNNVLSVVVYTNLNYAVPDAAGHINKTMDEKYRPTEHVSLIDTLNIDLNTGEDISLEDIFADDVDWLTVVNNQISRTLMSDSAFEETHGRGTYWGGSGLKLVSPFKGVPLNQEFYLSRQGLTFVFNHHNPEFDILYGPVSLSIDYGDFGPHIALAQRFYNKSTSIFTSNAPVSKELLVVDHSSQHKSVGEEKMFGESRVSVTYSYMEWLPEEIVSFIRQLAQDAWVRAEEMKTNIWELSYSVSVDVTGSFINITAWQNGYLKSGWGNLAQYYCFNKDYEPVVLSELFAKGFDYRSLVLSRLNTVLEDNDLLRDHSIDEIYSGLQFHLTPMGVQFCTAPINVSNQGMHSLIFHILYIDFGCDNMTIFD